MKFSKKTRETAKTVGIHVLAVLATLFIIFPIYWLIISALRSPEHILDTPPSLLPSNISTFFVDHVFREFAIGRYLFNSVFLSLTATFATLMIAALAAFSYRMYRYRAKETFSKLILFVYMFPQILIIIPIYLLMSKLGLINTWFGLILCYIAFEMPICIWTLQSYFATIPRDLVEAAEIDGMTRIRTLWKIFVPVALPGFASSGIMTFIGIWNNFLLANTLLVSDSLKTLPVIVADFSSRDSMLQGDVLAASLVVSLPSFFFALFFQRYLVGGLTEGAVK